ncbi:MAG: hypothetical protein HY421_02745, partial [Candidatus Kerfeldbacteria bacterium]|nr:hypothetical protein [Candidatus Kerfeldbacteria bacterium]
RGQSDLERGLGLGALSGLVSLTVHSLFVNSLLFPHLMATLALVLGVLVGLRIKSIEAAA